MYLSDPVAFSWYATNLQFNQIRDTYCVLVESRLILMLLAALLRALSYDALLRVSSLALLLCPALMRMYFIF